MFAVGGRASAWVIPTDEEHVIARSPLEVLGRARR
jgi:acetate kinase